jgi:hypothetical protein
MLLLYNSLARTLENGQSTWERRHETLNVQRAQPPRTTEKVCLFLESSATLGSGAAEMGRAHQLL